MEKIISAIILTLVVNFSIAAQDSKQKVDPQTTTQTEHCDQTKNHKHRGHKHNSQDCTMNHQNCTDKNHKHNSQDCTMNHQNCTDKNYKHNNQDCTMNHQNCTDKNHKHSDTQKK
ncbi:hypothetical protein [Myroides marinus]|uniref:hypothetical protein n=1 Tax=Myroides marinus TaxID=703342 RepID=UPI002574A24F|nr:hypothetical protein [Myroides marinus]MDM1379127.1 hypothetical protein [Myroides marinus]MDM1386398.1 hypothetical protein [Myroides marinus]MDM1393532.1 hypothetical protein [Myroides marinus]MDM1503389.1 hypothetical protein [Myroides marinus]